MFDDYRFETRAKMNAPAQADEAFGPVSAGDPESPHELTGQPTAQDLDTVAEEQAITEQTGAIPPEEVIRQVSVTDPPEKIKAFFEQKLPIVDLPVAAPVAPAPRHPGCGHGFSNARLCPTCRASGV